VIFSLVKHGQRESHAAQSLNGYNDDMKKQVLARALRQTRNLGCQSDSAFAHTPISESPSI
jgi:hypothetical protein